MMPKRQEIGDIVSWYERQLNKMKVKMLLNTLVDAGLLEAQFTGPFLDGGSQGG